MLKGFWNVRQRVLKISDEMGLQRIYEKLGISLRLDCSLVLAGRAYLSNLVE